MQTLSYWFHCTSFNDTVISKCSFKKRWSKQSTSRLITNTNHTTHHYLSFTPKRISIDFALAGRFVYLDQADPGRDRVWTKLLHLKFLDPIDIKLGKPWLQRLYYFRKEKFSCITKLLSVVTLKISLSYKRDRFFDPISGYSRICTSFQ